MNTYRFLFILCFFWLLPLHAFESSFSRQSTDKEWWIEGTGSMFPAIPRFRHKILVRMIPFSCLKKSMIVLRKAPNGQNIAHRLFKQISLNEWWARGDNNPLPDNDYVTPANYEGVIVAQDNSAIDPLDFKYPEWLRKKRKNFIHQ